MSSATSSVRYLDVTIVYPEGRPTFWHFLCGRVPQVVVRARRLPIPAEFSGGDYARDPQHRKAIQHWLQALWLRKGRRDRRPARRQAARLTRRYGMYWPPLTSMIWPVTYPLIASDAR